MLVLFFITIVVKICRYIQPDPHSQNVDHIYRNSVDYIKPEGRVCKYIALKAICIYVNDGKRQGMICILYLSLSDGVRDVSRQDV